MRESLRMPVKVRPYLHQQAAFDFACKLFGLIPSAVRSRGVALLMEMGCGKTLTAIAIAGILYQCGLVCRVPVVAPLSILGVWEEEFASMAGFPYTLTVLRGTGEKKRRQIREMSGDGLQILVVNYESARILEPELLRYDAGLIIADEGHKIKEGRSKQSRAMHSLGDRASYRLLLTGTLITNRELDVFSEYRFLNSTVFGNSFYAFRSRYFDMVGYGSHIPKFRQWMTDDFLRRMHSIAYRVTKDECLDLPEITEEVVPVELEPKAMKAYRELEDDSFTELKDGEVTAMNVLTRLLRLSQLTGGHVTDDASGVYTVSTAKLDALSDILDSAADQGQKAVVMARFVAELDDIEELLRKKKIPYAAVRGGVKDRAAEVARFQTDPECRVFVGQIAAAGLGLTLTSANLMVFYSLDYSMSNFDQAKARIHRAGQTMHCHYFYLTCTGTVDRKVLRSLRSKADLARMLVDDYRRGQNPFRA